MQNLKTNNDFSFGQKRVQKFQPKPIITKYVKAKFVPNYPLVDEQMSIMHMRVSIYFGCRYFADPLDYKMMRAMKHSDLVEGINVDLVRYTISKMPSVILSDEASFDRSLRLFAKE